MTGPWAGTRIGGCRYPAQAAVLLSGMGRFALARASRADTQDFETSR
jgi:hypothetical protein